MTFKEFIQNVFTNVSRCKNYCFLMRDAAHVGSCI